MSDKSQQIPKSMISSPHEQHWWFDQQRHSQSKSCPTSSSGTTDSEFHSLADPNVAIPLPAAADWNKWRRDSLKDLYEDDNATDRL